MSVLYSVDMLRDAVSESLCYSDVTRKLGVSLCTFNFKRIQKLCDEYGISVDHFDVKKAFRRNKKEYGKNEIFVENSRISRSRLRPACIRLGIYPGKCGECGIEEVWNGKPLIIEVDHINGNSTDNRLENLRFLCPNCHSQTHTYRRRISRRTE